MTCELMVRLQTAGCLGLNKRTVFCRHIQRYGILRRICRSISCSASMESRGSAADRLEERTMRDNAIGCLMMLTLSLLTVPLTATAQPAAKVWRIGYLTPAFIPRASLFASYR